MGFFNFLKQQSSPPHKRAHRSKVAFPLIEDLFPVLADPVVRIGTARKDILIGHFGNDLLSGKAGNDLLVGLSGNDTLLGEEGDDLLLGGLGDDLLDGGAGYNSLVGGPGADAYILDREDSFDLVFDYQGGEDQFVLQDGLTFAQLAITQQANDTLLRYLGDLKPSVLLKNTQTSTLTTENFHSTSLIPTFDSLFVFGDSLSDPGNLLSFTGGLFPPPPYSEGQFSDGDIWTDFFTVDLKLDPLRQVKNFSIGGALTGRENGLEPLLESLTGVPIELPGVLDEIDQFTAMLGNEKANSNGLYVIWAGANDLLNLPSDPLSIPPFIANSVQNIVTAVTTLAAEGADTFLIPNLPDLGLIPQNLSSGNSLIARSLSTAFNNALDNALTILEADPLTDIDIVTVDIFDLTREIINAPDEFRFTNVTDPLIQQNLPDNPGFFWWDEQHPTEKVQDLLSDVFQANLFEAGYLLNSNMLGTLLSSNFTDIYSAEQALDNQGVTYASGRGASEDSGFGSEFLLSSDVHPLSASIFPEPSVI